MLNIKWNNVAGGLIMTALFAASSGIAKAESCHAQSGSARVAVIELYTSEGCSSCPPADKWLMNKSKTFPTSQAIFLSNHVPYWDYIGWKDPFAKEFFEKRQRHLAYVNNTNVYTPQFFVNGREARGTGALSKSILAVTSDQARVNLAIDKLADGRVQFSWKYPAGVEQISGSRLVMALTSQEVVSKVTAGENSNRTLRHAEVTRWWQGPARIESAVGQVTTKLPNDVDDNGRGQIVFMMIDAKDSIVQAVALSRECTI